MLLLAEEEWVAVDGSFEITCEQMTYLSGALYLNWSQVW